MSKVPFTTKEKLEEIIKQIPTPFHIYDEKGIRETARKLYDAFSWNKGFREYFAVKATPNPYLMEILKEEGCGFDCSSYTELMLSDKVGAKQHDIMFSSNATPDEDFKLAYKLGAIINLDDFTHIDVLDKLTGIPETICCRYNPGGEFKTSEKGNVMDTPKDAKYGMTHEQIIEAYKILKEKGAKRFGMHAFLASNTLTNEYYPVLAGILFRTAVEIKEKTGVQLSFINLSGGVGVPYKPDQPANDIKVSVRASARLTKRYSFRQVWAMLLSSQSLADICLHPTAHLLQRLSVKSISTRNISVLTLVPLTLCVLPSTVHIIILRLWARKISPATTNTI